jgi:1-deoxy-D-xylulose-5-phosphate synthase
LKKERNDDMLNDLNPKVVRKMTKSELKHLAMEIRAFLIESISQTGGHLSSNLGVVEVTLALHYVFDFSIDKLFIDVGHQAYVHKIVTGRAARFHSLRQFNGLSGFQKFAESEFDHWESGHVGTALSGALGAAIAQSIDGKHNQIVTLIGDGSVANGVSFEAINHIAYSKQKVIIVLNDNNMSISKNVGAFANILSKMRASKSYRGIKYDIKSLLGTSKLGKSTSRLLHQTKEFIKHRIIKTNYFTDFGFEYYGPVDGHSFTALINAFEAAKSSDKPVVVHVVTTKGKGYEFSEQDDNGKWHGVAKFDIDSGETTEITNDSQCSWSKAIADTVQGKMAENEKIFVITPAMINGSKLENIFNDYPSRSIDTGIAEEHAATLAAGLALAGKRPFLSIYSTFLQRAYDQINHDICRMNLPVLIGIDRCGLVGEDGPTHHGVFDIGILRPLPNIVIAQPKDYHEAVLLINTALAFNGPFAIRYPRGNVKISECDIHAQVTIGSWESITIGLEPKSIIITYGPQVDIISTAIMQNQLSALVVNARFFKPLDESMILWLVDQGLPMIVYEVDQQIGGLGSAILEFINTQNLHPRIKVFGIGDHFVEQGALHLLKQVENIDSMAVINYIKDLN